MELRAAKKKMVLFTAVWRNQNTTCTHCSDAAQVTADGGRQTDPLRAQTHWQYWEMPSDLNLVTAWIHRHLFMVLPNMDGNANSSTHLNGCFWPPLMGIWPFQDRFDWRRRFIFSNSRDFVCNSLYSGFELFLVQTTNSYRQNVFAVM